MISLFFLQSAHTQGNPSFYFHAPGSKHKYPCTLNSIGCPKIFPQSAPVLYWLSHLTCISSLKAKNVDFHTAKNIQIQATLFLYFQTNSYKLTSDLFVVVWPVLSGRNFETAAEQRAQEAGKRLFHQAVGKVTGTSEPRGETARKRIKSATIKRKRQKGRRNGPKTPRDIFG